MKTWGKEPESLEGIIRTFSRDLAEYPAEKILKAISTHARRSQEFPTTADIDGMIKRNGRPPLRESDIIAIRKKSGEDRSAAEWQMLRDWEMQQQTGWDDYQPDPTRAERHREENNRLREEIDALKAENRRLAGLLADAKRQPPESKITQDVRIQNTINWMKETGASQYEIDQFIQSMEKAAA